MKKKLAIVLFLLLPSQFITAQIFKVEDDFSPWEHKIGIGTRIFPFAGLGFKNNISHIPSFFWVDYQYNLKDKVQFSGTITYNYFQDTDTRFHPFQTVIVDFRSREIVLGVRKQFWHYKNILSLYAPLELLWRETTTDTSKLSYFFSRGPFWVNSFYGSTGIGLEIWPLQNLGLSTEFQFGAGYISEGEKVTVYTQTYILRSKYRWTSIVLMRALGIKLKYKF